MRKILITTSSFDQNNVLQADLLRNAEFEIVINPFGRRLNEEEIGRMLTEDVIGMIAGVEPLTKQVLTAAKNLRVIARCGVGIDNIDMEAARELGIVVSNTPDAPTLAVAELTVAHVLNLLRGVCFVDRSIRDGHWQPKIGSLLHDKYVGIIGFGRIGRKVAELLSAFGAKILVYDIVASSPMTNVTFMSLEDLLPESDLVTVHIPYTKATHHIIGERQLHRMKPTAYLLNLSRGGLIDEHALYEVLLNKRIAGAGLDVFEREPYTGPLIELDNIVLTAHIGSYAYEARSKQEREAMANLCKSLVALNLMG